ncbi:MAG TPA: hydrogenase nickel incorporation protein HypB [Rectinemataceae bacterium]|nr:hydrogenase nickel incorporation protein HypB [Rectinemataceae bacterium]
MPTIEIRRAVYEANDERAGRIRAGLSSRGIFTVNILGSPGAGKTSVISRLAALVAASPRPRPVAVIEGDVASDIDTRALRALGIEAWQIETGGDCHLNAAMIEGILGRMTLADKSWLFIENIGNLVCPAEFVIGEDLKLVVASAAEGSDKPYKYPTAFARSAACVLTKTDIAEAVGFDEDFFRAGWEAVSPGAPLFPVNGRTGEGAAELLSWLEEVAAARPEA